MEFRHSSLRCFYTARLLSGQRKIMLSIDFYKFGLFLCFSQYNQLYIHYWQTLHRLRATHRHFTNSSVSFHKRKGIKNYFFCALCFLTKLPWQTIVFSIQFEYTFFWVVYMSLTLIFVHYILSCAESWVYSNLSHSLWPIRLLFLAALISWPLESFSQVHSFKLLWLSYCEALKVRF